MIRIAIFLLTNIAILIVFNFIIYLTGSNASSTNGLLILASLSGFSGAFISLLLSKWIALRAVGGRLINKPTNDNEVWLVKTIKNQSKKVGINMPQVAIYDSPDINAFATGPRKNSSLIAISTGLIQNMQRDEAEAVLAHEISHINNGDMVTMTLIQGIVNTFVIFASRLIARFVSGMLNNSDDPETNNNHHHRGNPIVYFVVSTILELVFGILASIITMWFSRRREFYADAGSAKLVGKEKMISALQRLKTSYEPQEPSSIIAFCINGKSKQSILSELFMSHPPLEKRIEALFKNQYLS